MTSPRVLVPAAVLVLGLSGCAAAGAPLHASSAIPRTPADASAPAGADAFTAADPVPGPAARAVPVIDPRTRPVRLTAASVGIDTRLVDLAVAADGTVEVPSDDSTAGWLDVSPPPGARGPAVLAGHVDSTTGPAVFYRLRELVPGALVVVTRADGATVSFRVDGVEQYAKDAFPTAAVYGPVPGPVLRLITCGGVFDRSTGHYRDNTVVYATATGAGA